MVTAGVTSKDKIDIKSNEISNLPQSIFIFCGRPKKMK